MPAIFTRSVGAASVPAARAWLMVACIRSRPDGAGHGRMFHLEAGFKVKRGACLDLEPGFRVYRGLSRPAFPALGEAPCWA
jgi:hypothetical protein